MSEPARKRVLSGIQPTAEMHIGNYFGAVKNWAHLQDEFDTIYAVVDLHAMTAPYDPQALRRNSRDLLVGLLACGIDPEKSILFIQSLVPEHTELMWILSCFAAYGDLQRMTQFKEKAREIDPSGGGKQGEDSFISTGLFFYPVLQAADILAYKAHYVPVGRDQKQHLELSRGIARRFNARFGVELFPIPEVLFTKNAKIQSLADPKKKMSKSLGEKHYVGIFEDAESIRKKVRSAVTDSGDTPEGEVSDGVANLLAILEACGYLDETASMLDDYHARTLRYVNLKDAVADALVELTDGFKERRGEILSRAGDVDDMAVEMSKRARTMTRQTVDEVREVTGLPPLG